MTATLVAAVGAGCGAGRTSTRVTGSSDGSPGSPGSKPVTYRGAVLEVPASWPVYNLDSAQDRCARFDVHAVYLGHQGPDASCPATLLGKTEAVQVEPLDVQTKGRLSPSPSSASSAQINGQAVGYEPGSDTSHNIVASFPQLGIVVTASFATERALAQAVVGSVHAGTP